MTARVAGFYQARSEPTRTIVPVMFFATGIALVGHISQQAAGTVKVTKNSPPQLRDSQIILGGTIATVILTGIAQAGDIGASFAKGLSVITLVAVIAVYGTDIVGIINKVTGQVQTSTGIRTAPTKGSKPTTPTKGTS